MKDRCYKIDNLRALLILLVVLGHVLSLVRFPGSKFAYRVIYAFHMPAFAFVSGLCCSSGRDNKLFKTVLYPYIVFQTLALFCKAMQEEHTLLALQLQYVKPYWSLWYLLSLFSWKLLAGSLTFDRKSGWKILAVSAVVAILAGFQTGIGYALSLSRTIVLFPFFFLGLYVKTYHFERFRERPKRPIRLLALALAVGSTGCIYVFRHKIKQLWLFHSVSYSAGGGTWYTRGALLCMAGAFLLLLVAYIPDRNLPVVTRLGQNSLTVYILHSFVVRFLPLEALLKALPWKIVTVPLTALVCTLLLSTKPVVKLTRPLMAWPFKKSREDL